MGKIDILLGVALLVVFFGLMVLMSLDVLPGGPWIAKMLGIY